MELLYYNSIGLLMFSKKVLIYFQNFVVRFCAVFFE